MMKFLEVDPADGETIAKLDGGDVILSGPTLGGERIGGRAVLASNATFCGTQCSRAAWSIGGTTGAVHSLSLFSSSPETVGTTATSVTIDRFEIHLYSKVPGAVAGGVLEIPPLSAMFLLSADAESAVGWVPAWNTTPIQVRPVRGYWSTSSFAIDYLDANGDNWSLTLGPSVWRE